MAAIRFRPLLHGFCEGQVLKCVQRIVVHEDANRSLRGQQVRGVLNRLFQTLESLREGARWQVLAF
jgi:hypothetical protein